MIEILSPAGSFDSLVAGARAGADAVYFGGASFNARRNAENFSGEYLSDAVSYCHTRGVRAYLTLNTLISDSETYEAVSLVKSACESGIDGIIVQDLGLAGIIKSAAPNLPLHASTQMTIHTVKGVELMHSLGFKRVVLARECSRDDLYDIARAANRLGIELEIFIHGSLCMSVSGQCLLSAALGGRSGNRGLCAGTCRLPFKAENGSGFDLSLKDLSLLKHVKELEDMGIVSFKIEGRMKRPEYVAAAVNAVRNAVSESGINNDSLSKLSDVFSRSGFTDGYYMNKVDSDMFGIRNEDNIQSSKQVIASIHDLYRAERQSVPIDMHLLLIKYTPAVLTVTDGENNVSAAGDVPSPAVNRAADFEFIKSKLEKCGGTPYFVNSINAKIGDNLSISVSQLNTMRRTALEKLSELRAKPKSIAFKQPTLELKKKALNLKSPKIYVSLHNINQLPVSPKCADLFILPMSTSVEILKSFIEKGYNVAVKAPRVFFSRDDEIALKLKKFAEIGVKSIVAENLGAIPIIKSVGLKIIGGIGLNCYNSHTAKELEILGADEIMLSAELSEIQMLYINSNLPVGALSFGNMPLMVLKNCPVKSRSGCKKSGCKITDRKGIDFNLMCEDGVTMLYNNRPIYMADQARFLNSLDFITLLFTNETQSEVEQIISAYKSNQPPTGEFTRGLYQKGVK